MKILKIDNNKGYYFDEKKNEFNEIDKIDRDALLSLIRYVVTEKEINIDYIDETNNIDNKAQNIVYLNISLKLKEIIDNKEVIKKTINDKYKEAIDKYNI